MSAYSTRVFAYVGATSARLSAHRRASPDVFLFGYTVACIMNWQDAAYALTKATNTVEGLGPRFPLAVGSVSFMFHIMQVERQPPVMADSIIK